MRRLTALAAITLIVLCSACGSGSKGGGASQAQAPTDPRTVPTATLPAILPSAIPAVTVTEGSVSGQLNVQPSSYTVKAGDTMAAIAQKLGVPLALLNSVNPNVNPGNLTVGQVLTVPPASTASPTSTPGAGLSAARRTSTPAAGGIRTATPVGGAARSTPAASGNAGGATASGQTYTVKAGDTACNIAGSLHVSLADLASANGVSVSGLASLKIGQQLKVPSRTSASPGC
jgi:LysM repeat protein